ncbi:hypothetical protein GCM10022207_70010 [Streptomyces lannensis]|uniref:Uncharacterized protein n=1 Tax=Streptomyces lannensis TaxID=766498 RepID=A0ABP7L1Q2_9ACTN
MSKRFDSELPEAASVARAPGDHRTDVCERLLGGRRQVAVEMLGKHCLDPGPRAAATPGSGPKRRPSWRRGRLDIKVRSTEIG